MSAENTEEKTLQPHHEQQPLCTTRLPYRQGRKLTAVKVYTITTESNHLLVFGVPSLNLRQEAKALFLKFGNLQQFHVSAEHPGEVFTETYHAKFDRIQSARIAKRMTDTKSFYGGLLHVCYAPELETIDETRQKLLQRSRDVTYRLCNLDKEKAVTKMNELAEETSVCANIEPQQSYDLIQNEVEQEMLNMGNENIIYLKRNAENRKAKPKKFKSHKIEVVDCTSTEKETISNINEALNYNKFGNEVIRHVDIKPVNVIKFNKNKS